MHIQVQITGDATELKGAISDAVSSLADLKESAEGISDTIETLRGGIETLAGGELVNLAKESLESATQIKLQAQSLGLSTTSLQQYQYAASLSGVSNDQLTASLSRFEEQIGKANDGNQVAINAFNQLGVSASDLKNKNVDQILNQVANGFAAITDPGQRALLMMQTFGSRNGGVADLLNLFGQGAQSLDEFRQQALNVGAVLSDDVINNAAAASEQLDTLTKVIKTQLTQAAVDSAPALLDMGNLLAALATKGAQTEQGLKLLFQGPSDPFAQLDDEITAAQTKFGTLNTLLNAPRATRIGSATDSTATNSFDKYFPSDDALKEQMVDLSDLIDADLKLEAAYESAGTANAKFNATVAILSQQFQTGTLSAEAFNAQVAKASAAANGIKPPPKTSTTGAGNDDQFQKMLDSLQEQNIALTQGSDAAQEYKISLAYLNDQLNDSQYAQELNALQTVEDTKARLADSDTAAKLSANVAAVTQKLTEQYILITQGKAAADAYQESLDQWDKKTINVVAGMQDLNLEVSQAAQILSDIATPFDAYIQQVSLLNKLYADGVINQDTFNKGITANAAKFSQASGGQQIYMESRTPAQTRDDALTNLNTIYGQYQTLSDPTSTAYNPDAANAVLPGGQQTYLQDLQKIQDDYVKQSQKDANQWLGVWKQAGDSMATGIGNAFAEVIVDHENLATAAKQVLQDVTKEIISSLIKIGIEKAALDAWNMIETATQVAAFNAINTSLGTSGVLTDSAGLLGNLGLLGLSHDGIDSIPTTGTYLLEKGERVIPSDQNKQITDALNNNQGANINQQIMQSINQANRQSQTTASSSAAPVIHLSQSFTFHATDTQGMDRLIRQMTPTIQKVSVQAVQKAYRARGKLGGPQG